VKPFFSKNKTSNESVKKEATIMTYILKQVGVESNKTAMSVSGKLRLQLLSKRRKGNNRSWC
jgi:hypothetical protein